MRIDCSINWRPRCVEGDSLTDPVGSLLDNFPLGTALHCFWHCTAPTLKLECSSLQRGTDIPLCSFHVHACTRRLKRTWVPVVHPYLLPYIVPAVQHSALLCSNVHYCTVQRGFCTTTPRCYLHTHCLQSSITALHCTTLYFHTLSPPSLHHPLTVENPPFLSLLPSPPSSLIQPSFLHPP